MKPGSLVTVLGKLDNRIRDKTSGELIIGTLVCILCDDQVMVILENNDLFIGLKREVRLYEQKSDKKEEAEEKDSEEESGVDF